MDIKQSTSFPYKPIRATVVEQEADWIELWQMALTPPTPEERKDAETLVHAFFPDQVYP